MLRSVLSVLAGVIAGVLVIALVESLGHMLFPPPPGLEVHNPESLARLMSQIPIGAMIAVVVAWACGSITAGFAAAKVARQRHTTVALVAGGILLCLGGYSLVTIHHPLWMTVLGILFPLPAAWSGARLASPRSAA